MNNKKYLINRTIGFLVMILISIIILGIMVFWGNKKYFEILWPITGIVLFALYTKYTFYLNKKQRIKNQPAYLTELDKEFSNEKNKYERVYKSLSKKYNKTDISSLMLFKELKCICQAQIQNSTIMAASVAIVGFLVNNFRDIISTIFSILVKITGSKSEDLGGLTDISGVVMIILIFVVVITFSQELAEINKMKYILSIIEEVEKDSITYDSIGESIKDKILKE